MRTPLRIRMFTYTNAATPVNIDTPQIKPGQIARITHLALENESGESVTVKFGVEAYGSFDQLWANATVADSDAIGVMLNVLLLEGDKLRCRVTGAAKSGKITFLASGELEDTSPEVVQVTEVAP